ncbi:MAG: hypothetical protein KDA65_06615 [Planctomycetaceae bacterium]|nr:hypothetical protein [Planctomycetaceae bacterium]
MLTFFDYLRQRAYESILTGAQEALEFLERKKIQESAEQVQLAFPFKRTSSSPKSSSTSDTSPAQESPAPEQEKLPPPRRRGRPPKKSQGKPSAGKK